MNNLVTFLIASLLFHTVSPSKDHKLSHDPKSTKTVIGDKSKTARKLVKTFKNKEFTARNTPGSYGTESDVLMPFDFPRFEVYDMDLATRLSKRASLSPQLIFCYLVQIIYKLVQFHVTRFFKLGPFKSLVPDYQLIDGENWEDSPQGWFHVLFNAIMPGAVFYSNDLDEPGKLERIHVEPFTLLNLDDNMFTYTAHTNGTPKRYSVRHNDEMSEVVVYTLPSSFFGQTLKAKQAIVIAVELEGSYPHCKGILEHLLKGVTFALDLKSSRLEVIVKPTEDIPSIGKSMHEFSVLFKTPLKTQIVVPENVERILHDGRVPRLSCYHPANGSLGSIELYERMMLLIMVGEVSSTLRLHPNDSLATIMADLDALLKLYLPDAFMQSLTGNLSNVQLYTYNSNPPSMWIYKEEIDGKEIGVLLRFGEPVMLTHEQMGNLVDEIYPYSFEIPTLKNARTPVEKVLKCIIGEIEMRNASAPSSLMTAGKDTANTPINAPTNFNFERDRKKLNVIVRLLDSKSRNYSRNTASRFESPSVQKRVYEQSRRASLEAMFGAKLSITFDVFKFSSTSNVRHKVVPSLERNVSDSNFYYYFSLHSNNRMACERIEEISFPPGFDISKLISIPYEKYMNDPMFKGATV